MAKKTIEQIEVKGQRVLMRVDFNVPLGKDGSITDDRRIRMALPSIRSVLDRGGRLILVSHLGRPKGEGPEPGLSLEPAADRLRELLGGPTVRFIPGDCTSDEAAEAVDGLGDGEALVLDNLRFSKGEKKGDAAFAGRLASFADIYCSDAFGTAHRNDASMHTVPSMMEGKPKVAGFLLKKELEYLADAIERGGEQTGFIAVLGGAKVSDKLGAIRNLKDRVNTIMIGGAMAYTFLKARGEDVGDSRLETDMLDDAKAILDEVAAGGVEMLLPTDHVCGREFDAGTETRVFTGPIESGWMGLDIGPATRDAYTAAIRSAKTIVWNGPMGVFEMAPFEAGTKAVAEAIAAATDAGATSVIGGGDSAAAIEQFGLADRVSHVSTGGGASLQMLEGRSFDSVALLDDA